MADQSTQFPTQPVTVQLSGGASPTPSLGDGHAHAVGMQSDRRWRARTTRWRTGLDQLLRRPRRARSDRPRVPFRRGASGPGLCRRHQRRTLEAPIRGRSCGRWTNGLDQRPAAPRCRYRFPIAARADWHPARSRAVVRGAYQLWRPLAPTPRDLQSESWDQGLLVRLRQGGTPERGRQQLQAMLDAMVASVAPGREGTIRTHVFPLRDVYTGAVRARLLLVFAASLLLLGVACVNLANLMLARLAGRAAELATRVALGRVLAFKLARVYDRYTLGMNADRPRASGRQSRRGTH